MLFTSEAPEFHVIVYGYTSSVIYFLHTLQQYYRSPYVLYKFPRVQLFILFPFFFILLVR